MSEKETVYGSAELKRLWGLKYQDLGLATGEPGARLREARFIMEARTAWEAHRSQVAMVWATVVMALPPVVTTIATVVIAMKPGT